MRRPIGLARSRWHFVTYSALLWLLDTIGTHFPYRFRPRRSGGRQTSCEDRRSGTPRHNDEGPRSATANTEAGSKRKRPWRVIRAVGMCIMLLSWLGILRFIIGAPAFDLLAAGIIGLVALTVWILRVFVGGGRWISCMGILALTAYCCLLLSIVAYPYFGWTVDCQIRLCVAVRDSVTGRPVSSATVRLEGGEVSNRAVEATTGDDGTAMLVFPVEGVGRDALVFTRDWLDARGAVVAVSSPGYVSVRRPIQESLRNCHVPPLESGDEPVDAEVAVALVRKQPNSTVCVSTGRKRWQGQKRVITIGSTGF